MKRIVESLEPDFTLSDAMPLGDIPHLSIIKELKVYLLEQQVFLQVTRTAL